MSDKALENLKERSERAHLWLFAIPLLALMLSGLSGCDKGHWINTETIDPDKVYRLETADDDLRVYEWTSPLDGHKYIGVYGSNSPWGACKTCGKSQ